MTDRDALLLSRGAGSATEAEIASQPALWPRAVDAGKSAIVLQQRLRAGTTAYIGCGSTAHLARALAVSHRRSLPTPAWGAAASEVWLASSLDALHVDTMVAVSRSGETTETVEACKRAVRAGAGLVCVTTNRDSQLVELCDDAVIVDFATEQSVVQTRSFSCMLVASLAAQLTAAGQDAADAFAGIDQLGAAVLGVAGPLAERLADPRFDYIVVLGSGLEWPLACESALKIKEMSSTVAEAFPVLDFRHGPVSVADERTAVVVLCGTSVEHELAVAADAERFGASVFTVGSDPRCMIELPPGASTAAAAVSRLVMAQLAGLRRGLAKGIDPDAPRGVAAFVELPIPPSARQDGRTWPQ